MTEGQIKSSAGPEFPNPALPKSRRWLIGSIFSAALASISVAWYTKYFEPFNLEITRKKIGTCFRSPIASGLKFLHISDFHASSEVPYAYLSTVVDMAIDTKPDLIFATGDFITWHVDNSEKYRQLLGKLSEFCPVYACLGNHDGGSWASRHGGYESTQEIKNLLKTAGIKVLDNQSEIVTVRHQSIEIAGVGDLWSKELKPDIILPKMEGKLGKNWERPLFLLSHNPDSKIPLIEYDWDLMLSGHTHGGQLVVPFAGYRPFAPVYDKSHIEGLRQWEGRRWIHITRGIGNRHGVRFNCRPEMSLLET